MSTNEIGKLTGRIFDIQRFSIHDGPGIRTIVFLKGCSLRCRWCCNPEGQSFTPVTLHMAGKPPRLAGTDVTAESVMETVLKDAPYYRRSGGGLTLSGGECLLQPDFARALLLLSHENGVNTCIETAGHVAQSAVEAVLPLVDTFLFDVKHMDSAKHEAFTGQRNTRILENAAYIAARAKRMVVRVPVIPGFNDTAEEIRAIARFAMRLPHVEEMHLLPYHRLGQDKYTAIGEAYTMADILPLSKEKTAYLLSVAEESGLKCQIGG